MNQSQEENPKTNMAFLRTSPYIANGYSFVSRKISGSLLIAERRHLHNNGSLGQLQQAQQLLNVINRRSLSLGSAHVNFSNKSHAAPGGEDKPIGSPLGYGQQTKTAGQDGELPHSTSAKDPLDTGFADPNAAFKSKTTWELVRAYLVYVMCSSNYLVEHNMQV